MVKGVTRQVILVDSPDRQRFEKAIFILRDGSRESAEELLDQAREIADRSMGRDGRKRRSFPPPAWALLGAGLTGLLWLAVGLAS